MQGGNKTNPWRTLPQEIVCISNRKWQPCFYLIFGVRKGTYTASTSWPICRFEDLRHDTMVRSSDAGAIIWGMPYLTLSHWTSVSNSRFVKGWIRITTLDVMLSTHQVTISIWPQQERISMQQSLVCHPSVLLCTQLLHYNTQWHHPF